MSGSSGQLDGLLNYTFSGTDLGGLAVQSAQVSTVNFQSVLQTLTATATGTPFMEASETFKVTAVTDTTNAISLAIYDSFGEFVTNLTVYAIGFTSNAILVSTLLPGAAAQIAASQQSLSDLNGVVAAISTAPLASGASITFTEGATFACFALGTRIRSARGELAVEDIRAGDLVVSQLAGTLRQVVWVAHRTVHIARHPRPWDVAPVRVRAGAFGRGRPCRDLLLSPDHAVRVKDSLVPIRYLLNGATIAQEFPDRITDFHVELDAHDVLLAEGLACESYLDTGNRGAFANEGGPISLVPDFARDVWAQRGCLPLVLEGRAVAAEKRRLLARAKAMGWRQTTQPDFSVLADGRLIPVQACGAAWRAELPAGTTQVRLVSRAAVPAEVSATARDGRRLGIAVSDLRLDRVAPPADCYGRGWHTAEAGWRWTDGDAQLQTQGAREMLFAVVASETYWLPPLCPPTFEVRAA
jgi:hypothetical protein